MTRVAIDGPSVAAPDVLAHEVLEPLRLLGRPAVHLEAWTFWRDASVRLEHGREDVESFPEWLDAAALQREVLDPVADCGRYLPSLRDPATNRSTRARPRELARHGVLLVSGEFLLGRDLPFDLTVHIAVSAAARARRTPADRAWTLPAYDHYDTAVRPQRLADVVIRWNDVQRPAAGGLS